jgi:hypothetical protein
LNINGLLPHTPSLKQPVPIAPLADIAPWLSACIRPAESSIELPLRAKDLSASGTDSTCKNRVGFFVKQNSLRPIKFVDRPLKSAAARTLCNSAAIRSAHFG